MQFFKYFQFRASGVFLYTANKVLKYLANIGSSFLTNNVFGYLASII